MTTDEARHHHAALRQRLTDDGSWLVFSRRSGRARTGFMPLAKSRRRHTVIAVGGSNDLEVDDWEHELIALACAYGRARWCLHGNESRSMSQSVSALQLLVDLEAQTWQYAGMVLRELGVTDFLEFERARFQALNAHLARLGVK